ERLHLGDGDGVGPGFLDVVAGAGARVVLEDDATPVGLEQRVVQVDEGLGRLPGRLRVDVRARLADRRRGERVERRVGLVLHDLDLLGRDAGRGGPAVVALERLDAGR